MAMKKKELEQLKTKSVEELKKMSIEFRDKLWNLKTDFNSGKVKNVKEIKKTKKSIARVLTILKQNGK